MRQPRPCRLKAERVHPSGRLLARSLGLAGLLTLGACSLSALQGERVSDRPLSTPERVVVYDFAFAPDQIRLDRGLDPEVADLLKVKLRSAREHQAGRAFASNLSSHLVEGIFRLGMVAERSARAHRAEPNTLLIRGQILSVDRGAQGERMSIGLSSRRSTVKAHVQVIEVLPDRQLAAVGLDATARHGQKPRSGQIVGVGAVAGRLLMSTTISVSSSRASDPTGAHIDVDARRVATKVTRELSRFFSEHGWTDRWVGS